MFKGSVISIHISPVAAGAMLTVAEARAIPGRGLEGDRYALQSGTFSKPEPDREITLIEAEALEGLKTETGADLPAGVARRNIVTRNVPLNHLVGREFRVAEVRLRGLSLCEPCAHLARLSDKRVLPGLVHRGGLRAQILTEGFIRANDSVTE
jgi:MOSC domain-containing protein YiiM